MSEVQSGEGRGRRISLELNLVPFIDLMSVLITFLLITAVWSQVSMMQIGSSIYGKKTETSVKIPPQADVVLKLEIRDSGYLLFIGSRKMSLPKINNEYDDQGLVAQLQKAKELYPNKIDGAISMSDDLPYLRLIAGMDSFLKAGFPTISVLTGGPQ